MATQKRRQVIYIDDDNLSQLATLKANWAFSHFVNWAIREFFSKYSIKHCPSQVKDEKAKQINA